MMNIHRFLALTRKEFYQMLRDPSSFLIGIVIPLMLIVLMGSGLSLDVKNLPVAVALEDTSPTARDALSFLNGSLYFSPSYVTSSKEAIALMDARQADAANRALSAVAEARGALRIGMTPDVVLTDCEAALAALGELNGKQVRDDLVDTIFSRFCVGK